MVYIPDEWLVDKDKGETIHALFAEYFPGDILTQEQAARQKEFPERLRELGETEVLKHYEAGEIVIL